MGQLTLGWPSTDCWSSVDRMSTEYWLGCWLSINKDVKRSSGPLFFIIYINDLPGVISKDSSIALYADDSKLYIRIINSQDDMSSFQDDLDKIMMLPLGRNTSNIDKYWWKRTAIFKDMFRHAYAIFSLIVNNKIPNFPSKKPTLRNCFHLPHPRLIFFSMVNFTIKSMG